MSTKVWLGGAASVAQVDTVTIPLSIEIGMVFTFSIGYKEWTYIVTEPMTRDEVVDAIVAGWNAVTMSEYAEIVASVDYADSYEGGQVYTGKVKFTAVTAGKPFTFTVILGTNSNEKQTVIIGNSPSGGTFTLTFDGATTDPLDHDATAEEVQTALEALSNIGADNVTVSGDDGGPYTITFVGDLAATDVAKIQGDPTDLQGINEVQTITLSYATGGTFTLFYEGQETGNLAHNDSAATVQAALEGLSTIGASNVTVSGSDGGPYTVTFVGDLSKTDIDSLVFDGSNLTGGLSVSVSTTSTGSATGVNERWSLYQMRAANYYSGYPNGYSRAVLTGDETVTGGRFDLTITIDGDIYVEVTDVPYDVTVEELHELLLAANNVGEDDYSILLDGAILVFADSGYTGNAQLTSGTDFNIAVNEMIGGTAIYPDTRKSFSVTVDGANLTGSGAYNITTSSSLIGLQKFSGFSPDPESTTRFEIIIDGQSTGKLPNNSSYDEIQSALESLSSVGSGNIQLTSTGSGSPYLGRPSLLIPQYGLEFEFTGDLANRYTGKSVSLKIWNTDNTLWDGKSYAKRMWRGEAGDNETQEVSISDSPSSGTFILTFNGKSTDPINHDASSAAVQSALESVGTVGSENVVCTGGPLPDTAVEVEFVNDLGGQNVSEMTASGNGGGTVVETTAGGGAPYFTVTTIQEPLIHTTTTVNAGPNDYTTTDNWSTNELPVDGDKVYLLNTAYSILYGLDQEDVTLAELHIENSFTGFVGLPVIHVNGTITYPEYRDQYLKIGATDVFIGDKSGAGSNRLKLNFGTVQTSILITNSGSRITDSIPPILLLGTHDSNTLDINRGDVGVAHYPGEVSTFATIRQAFIDSAETDATLYVGDDVTLTNIYKSGGVLTLRSATTILEQTAGATTIYEGAHAQIDSYDGDVYYNSIGTLSAIGISGDTTLSFDQDRRPKTVTVIDVYGSEPEVFDQSGSIVSPSINLQRGASSEQLNFGSNINISISSIA